MTIQLNGKPHLLPAALTVTELLTSLDVDGRLVAVELNRVVVRRADFATTRVQAGAEVEIVSFVGGG